MRLVGYNRTRIMFGMTALNNQQQNNESLNTVLKRFYENLPSKPYCTNGFELEGLKINRKIEAVKKPYIQYNHPMWKKYIIVDIDLPGAVVEWLYEKSHLPAPNIIIENKDNGRAHFIYELMDAVSFTEKSSIKAQQYYSAVERALTRELEGDERYTGLISKNPLSNQWRVSIFKTEPYHLKDLASKLELNPVNVSPLEKAQNDDDVICGRNDEVFHSVRRLAYKDVREFRNSGRVFTHWFYHVLSLVKEKNSNFINPLDYKECCHIAKSISNYTFKHDQKCYEQFVERQRAKGSNGGKKKSAKYEAVRIAAKKLFRMGVKLLDIAEKLKISYRTVLRYTKGLAKLKLLDFNEINKSRTLALAKKSMERSGMHKSSERSEGIKMLCDTSQNQVLAPSRACPAFLGIFLKNPKGMKLKILNIDKREDSEVSFYYCGFS